MAKVKQPVDKTGLPESMRKIPGLPSNTTGTLSKAKSAASAAARKAH